MAGAYKQTKLSAIHFGTQRAIGG